MYSYTGPRVNMPAYPTTPLEKLPPPPQGGSSPALGPRLVPNSTPPPNNSTWLVSVPINLKGPPDPKAYPPLLPLQSWLPLRMKETMGISLKVMRDISIKVMMGIFLRIMILHAQMSNLMKNFHYPLLRKT